MAISSSILIMRREETSRIGAGCSAWLDGSRRSIFPNDLRYQILADDGAERDVGNWDADDKADDLNELSRLRNGSSTGTDECGCETADDQRNKPRAANSYDKKEQPRFEVLEFCWFFGHCGGINI